MKSFNQFLDEELTTDEQSIFFVGCQHRTYDMQNQKFISYKAFNRITLQSSAFGSSTYEYAFSYAYQYSEKDKPGVIVAFKLPPGKKFFELKNESDYLNLGFEKDIAQQMALIFKECEPYFAIHTVTGQRVKAVPPEFKMAQLIVKYRSTKKFNGSNIEDILLNNDSNIYYQVDKKELSQIYSSYIQFVFENFFKDSKIKNTSFEQFLSDMHENKFKDQDELFSRYGIDKESIKKTAFFDKNGNFIKVGFIRCYPESMKSDVLLSNYSLLFKDQNRSYAIDSNSFNKINAYMRLFELEKKYINDNYNPSTNNTFCNGIEKIKKRLSNSKNKADSKDEGKHLYINLIQYVLFSMLTYDKLPDGSENPYIGVYSPEFKGYAEIHHATSQVDQNNDFKDFKPYGYRKSVNANTICCSDKTIIITKPFMSEEIETVGYYVDQFLDIQYNEIKKREKDKKTGKDVITTTYTKKPNPREKVKSSYFEYFIENVIENNPHLTLQEYKEKADKLISTGESYEKPQETPKRYEDYFYGIFFIDSSKQQPLIDWFIVKNLKDIKQVDMSHLDMESNAIKCNDGTVLNVQQLLDLTGKNINADQIEIYNINKPKHLSMSQKHSILKTICNIISKDDKFLQHRSNLKAVQNLDSLDTQERNEIINQLPVSDQIKRIFTKKESKDGRRVFDLSLNNIENVVDADTGKLWNPVSIKTHSSTVSSLSKSDQLLDKLVRTIQKNIYNIQYKIKNGEDLHEKLEAYEQLENGLKVLIGTYIPTYSELKDQIKSLIQKIPNVRINKLDQTIDEFYGVQTSSNTPREETTVSRTTQNSTIHEYKEDYFGEVQKKQLTDYLQNDTSNGSNIVGYLMNYCNSYDFALRAKWLLDEKRSNLLENYSSKAFDELHDFIKKETLKQIDLVKNSPNSLMLPNDVRQDLDGYSAYLQEILEKLQKAREQKDEHNDRMKSNGDRKLNSIMDIINQMKHRN